MPKKTKKTDSKKSKEPTKIEQTKLFKNYLKVTEQFVAGRSYLPLSQGQLMEKLHIIDAHQDIFHIVLEELVKRKLLKSTKGLYQATPIAADIVSGIIRMHPRGFGFVQAEDPIQFPQDIFIPKHLTKNAVDGDSVEVLINTQSFSEKGPEGKVVAITSRGRTHLAGVITQVVGKNPMVYVPMLGSDQRVFIQEQNEETLVVGDRVVLEVIEWGGEKQDTLCRLSHKIGHILDPSCDIAAAIEEFEIRCDFPHAALEEAESFGTAVSQKEIAKREDLRKLTCLTIDPDTAKDYDDAINVSKDEKGFYHLGVHIADVSHYVKPSSALDIEALKRCNSTYFPGKCIPMLPSELSDNLCSLKPKVNRLTISVFMSFDPYGEMIDYRIAKTVIKSAHRFTYKEAKQVLDQKKKSPFANELSLMVELCQLLKKKRYERGSVEFAMPELVVLVNETGEATGTDYVEYDVTHQMVEEFMLKANETVAKHLNTTGRNLPYRVHDEPSEENLRDFAALAEVFGFSLPSKPTPSDIQKMFDEAFKTSFGQYLATSYIRRMRLAVYSPNNIGHYGLALTHYCHFTSPIRRYVDLVAHRLLFEEPADILALEAISQQCSEQERISSKAESSVVLLKKLRLLQKQNKENPQREYEAVLTRIKPFGFYFEVLELMLEGFIHISEIGNDYYHFNESTKHLMGERGGKRYTAGDKVFVQLKNIDFITLQSEWILKNEDNTPPKKKKSRGRR